MEIPEITLILVGLLITLVAFGTYLVLMELSSLRAHLRVVEQRQEQHHFEVMNRLKMLSVSMLTGLRDSCIASERYEDAQRLTAILERDYKECFHAEEQPKNPTHE